MTKTEFIDKYGKRSKLMQWRVKGGFDVGIRSLRAFSCDCGEEGCRGWQMVNTSDLQPDAVELYGFDLSTMDVE